MCRRSSVDIPPPSTSSLNARTSTPAASGFRSLTEQRIELGLFVDGHTKISQVHLVRLERGHFRTFTPTDLQDIPRAIVDLEALITRFVPRKTPFVRDHFAETIVHTDLSR